LRNIARQKGKKVPGVGAKNIANEQQSTKEVGDCGRLIHSIAEFAPGVNVGFESLPFFLLLGVVCKVSTLNILIKFVVTLNKSDLEQWSQNFFVRGPRKPSHNSPRAGHLM